MESFRYMIFLLSLVIAFIMIQTTPEYVTAHQFTEFVKQDLITTSKYGIDYNYILPLRNPLTDHPREYIVNNKIRSMSLYYCKASGAPFKKSYEEYDDAGNITKSFDFDPDGSVAQMTIYKYCDKFKIAEKARYSPAGNIDSRQCYKYDDSGAISEFEYFGRYDKPSYKFEFLRSGSAMREIKRPATGGAVRESIYYYSNGRLVKKTFDSQNDGKVRQAYNYDRQNRLLNVITMNAENSEIYRWDYKYNENNMPVEIAFREPRAESTIKRTLLYDSDGELISLESKIASPKLNISSLQLFEHDADGNWTFKSFNGEGASAPFEISRYGLNGCRLDTVVYSNEGDFTNVLKYKYSTVCTETLPADPSACATAANIKKECVRNLKMIECAIELYQMENGGNLPDSLEKLFEGEDLGQVPKCSAKGKYSFAMNNLSEDAETPYLRLKVECGVHGGLY